MLTIVSSQYRQFQSALTIVQELPKLLEKGGFHLTKWFRISGK